MRVLIVEDVTLIAERIERLTREYFKPCQVKTSHSIDDARFLVNEEPFDLLFLDLNLNGEDGFELLKELSSTSFLTIVITANKSEAARAFDLGVFDFISKPLTKKRFEIAVERFKDSSFQKDSIIKTLTIRSNKQIELIEIKNILYVKASGHYTDIYLKNSEHYLYDKSIEKCLEILPQEFLRIHRSYITNRANIKRIINHGAGRYEVELLNNKKIPLNRVWYKKLTI